MANSKRKERRRIQNLLSKRLGPEYISYRQGFNGMKLAYIEGWVAISIANRIFGYDGWSSEIKSINLDFCDELPGKISLGISVTVRVTLTDGNYKEDVGFGSSENQKSKVCAFEKAKKEAVTDAIKRALRQFGDALGNCCYDKIYVSEIQKVVRQNNKNFQENNLIRRNEELRDEDFSDNISSELERLDLTNE